MEIRKATEQDADRLAPLFDQYRRFYKQASDLPGARAFLVERLIKRESEVFYAEINQTVVGFVQLYPSFSSIGMKRLWVLNDLFVLPEARRQSTARALLRKSEEFAAESGARGLTLKTALDNAPARHLYETAGWKLDEIYCSYTFTTVDKSS